MAQGTVSHLRGGTFRAGMIGGFFGHMSAGLAAATSKAVGAINAAGVAVRTATAAVIGGTISWASGGKFANGATSAAFTHLFNAETTAEKRQKQIDDVKARALRSNLPKSLKNIIDKTTVTYKEDASYTFSNGKKGFIYGVNKFDGTIDLTSRIWSQPQPGNTATAELIETFFHEIQHSVNSSFVHNYHNGTIEATFTNSYRSNMKNYYQTR